MQIYFNALNDAGLVDGTGRPTPALVKIATLVEADLDKVESRLKEKNKDKNRPDNIDWRQVLSKIPDSNPSQDDFASLRTKIPLNMPTEYRKALRELIGPLVEPFKINERIGAFAVWHCLKVADTANAA